jgi:hypothetical protein
MKIQYLLLVIGLAQLRACSLAAGQGTVIYDQQSADETMPGEVAFDIQSNQPLGQSFTPGLPAVGFVRLELFDGHPGNAVGARLTINLRANSIAGPILATTPQVILPDGPGPGFGGSSFVDFFFSAPISVAQDTTYFFQPAVQSGDQVLIGAYNPNFNYPGGMLYANGTPNPASDLWFREGIIVPEPVPSSLVLIGAFLFAFKCSRIQRR